MAGFLNHLRMKRETVEQLALFGPEDARVAGDREGDRARPDTKRLVRADGADRR